MNVALAGVFVNRNYQRRGSRTATKSKMEHFVIIVNGWKLGCCSL